MADGYNKVQLLGNLGGDPELKGEGKNALLKLRIATTESWFDKEANKREERTEWHNATVWGSRAEGLAKILGKGDRVFIEGSIRNSTYEKDGEKRYSYDIRVNELVFAGSKRQGSSGGGGGSGGAPEEPEIPVTEAEADAEIPFGAPEEKPKGKKSKAA